MDNFFHKDYFYRLILCAKKLSASSQPAIRGYWDFKRINSTGDDDVSIYSGTMKPHVLRENKDFNTKARPSSAFPLPVSSYRQPPPPPPPPHQPLSMGKSGSAVSVIGLSISTSFSVSEPFSTSPRLEVYTTRNNFKRICSCKGRCSILYR